MRQFRQIIGDNVRHNNFERVALVWTKRSPILRAFTQDLQIIDMSPIWRIIDVCREHQAEQTEKPERVSLTNEGRRSHNTRKWFGSADSQMEVCVHAVPEHCCWLIRDVADLIVKFRSGMKCFHCLIACELAIVRVQTMGYCHGQSVGSSAWGLSTCSTCSATW